VSDVGTTIERKVGRLVEIRASGRLDVSGFGRVIALANEVGHAAKVVGITDARQGEMLSPSEGQTLATLMRANMSRVELWVILVGERDIRLHVGDHLQQAVGSPAVRVAGSVHEAIGLLAPLLDVAELARAQQFLAAAGA
jgi:hypothetical protein